MSLVIVIYLSLAVSEPLISFRTNLACREIYAYFLINRGTLLYFSDLCPIEKEAEKLTSYLQQQCLNGRSIPINNTDCCRRDSIQDPSLARIVGQPLNAKTANVNQTNAGPASPQTSRSTAIGLLSPTPCLSRIGTMKYSCPMILFKS